MTSQIFNAMGIGGLDPAILFIVFLVLILILLIVDIVQGVKLKKLKKTYEGFMAGKNGKSMEAEITALFKDIRFLKGAQKKDASDIRAIRENLTFAYQKVGMIRYDAFREMGGKLSFSIALLNDRDDGFIINSVHSSEGCYTYTKEIKNGRSSIVLGQEEQKALDRALAMNSSGRPVEPVDEEDEPVDMDEMGFEEL